jgi:platelet-activating factor acetylhydrolase IB subunit alpha
MHTGELLFTFVGHDNWVKDLVMHPKGKYLYSVSDDKTLRVWDLTYGKEKKKIEAHENFITTIKFHPKYAVIATASFDCTIKIWSLK